MHKAPANEPVRGAVDLAYRVTRPEHDVLNPKGVNVIRFFAGEGIRLWAPVRSPPRRASGAT
ncbi:phage tail sheath subtilisin-like domain-containing protein [Micromonospora sp. BRA006-A]|nr:phage tail sheath subtilisin-like domain-containing protein [Micromonospora sp. BRA006-A]